MTAQHEGPNYDQAIFAARQENVVRVTRDLESGASHLVKKIRSFSEQFGFDENDVRKKIREDKMFRAQFAIDPRKQNTDRKTALNWMKERGMSGIKMLPKTGINAKYIGGKGGICTGKKSKGKNGALKSLDFCWTAEDATFYIMHKRTTDSGGAQGNVKIVVEQAIKVFSKSTQRGAALVVLLDGDYWTDEKLDDIKQYARAKEPPIHVMRTSQIQSLYEEHVA